MNKYWNRASIAIYTQQWAQIWENTALKVINLFLSYFLMAQFIFLKSKKQLDIWLQKFYIFIEIYGLHFFA